MEKMYTILIVEDSPSLARTYQSMLKGSEYDLTIVHDGQSAFSYLKEKTPDGILLDLNLPDMHGLDILKKIKEKNLKTSVIVVTSDGSIDRAIQCMKAGARDFLVKPFNKDQINLILKNVLKNTSHKPAPKTSSLHAKKGLEGFIGQSPQMKEVFQILKAAAASTASVFILGESGVGKELASHAIHMLSPRHHKPMIAINCAAIPDELMQSEIFGHVKGAFTGAINRHEGAAERADTGSLFLDELAEMPLTMQTKFLRFLQTREYQRIGDPEVRKADIRFIAATNKPPIEAIQKGILREDLYYRLSVVSVEIPPLRERGEDIILIAEGFLEKFNKSEQKSFKEFSPEVMQALSAYAWPGNVRELQNVIRGIIVLNSGEIITENMLPASILQRQDNTYVQNKNISLKKIEQIPPDFTSEKTTKPKTELSIEPLWITEKKAIEQAIELCNGNIKKAAEALEINPSTLYRKKLLWEKN